VRSTAIERAERLGFRAVADGLNIVFGALEIDQTVSSHREIQQ